MKLEMVVLYAMLLAIGVGAGSHPTVRNKSELCDRALKILQKTDFIAIEVIRRSKSKKNVAVRNTSE